MDLSENAAKDLSLAVLQPYFHVAIYRVDNEPDFSSHPEFPGGMEVIWHAVSKDYYSAVMLLREVTKPRWSDREAFSKIEHDLVVLYFHKASNLLFINSTRRTLEFYRLLGTYYSGGNCRLLSLNRINRVLAGIANAEFFSVGMKCSAQNSNTESYRIIAGPNAHKAISPTDGRLYHRGHVFGKGESEPGDQITIGYSSSSKVWSNQTGRVAELIAWCEELAAKLDSNVVVKTNTELDHLDVGEELAQLPGGAIAVGWSEDVYKHFPRAMLTGNGGLPEPIQLADIGLELISQKTPTEKWLVRVAHPLFAGVLVFTLDNGAPSFAWERGQQVALVVLRNEEEIPFLDYLEMRPLDFYLGDFSRLRGNNLFRNDSALLPAFESKAVKAWDWLGSGIDIEIEFTPSGLNTQSALA